MNSLEALANFMSSVLKYERKDRVRLKHAQRVENVLTQQVPFWACKSIAGSWTAFSNSWPPCGGNEWVDANDLLVLSTHWISFHSEGLVTLQTGGCSVWGSTSNQGNFLKHMGTPYVHTHTQILALHLIKKRVNIPPIPKKNFLKAFEKRWPSC